MNYRRSIKTALGKTSGTVFFNEIILQVFIGHDQFSAGDTVLQVGFGDRLAEQIALEAITADLVEEVGLNLRLHAFGQREHIDPIGHLDDTIDERPRLFAALEVGQETHIDLNDVELIVFQDVERRNA